MNEPPTGVGYFADPVGGLDGNQWDELAGDHFYSSAFWLRLCDLEPGGTSGGLHVDLPGGGRAAVPVIAVGDNPHPNTRWRRLLTARGLPSPPDRGILVGQRRGYLAHLLATEGTDLAAAASALLDEVRSCCPPVPGTAPARVALYLTTPDVLALREAGVRAMPVALAADASIEIPAGGWDAFLASLSSHRARRIRSEARRFSQAGYHVEQRALGEAHADVARLAFQVARRYGKADSIDPFLTGFRLQGEFAGPRAQVLLCSYDGGPPVGCCLYYRDGGTVYLRAVGFDYDRLRGVAEYFNLTYYIPAQMPGVRRLHAGIASPDAKALRGARLEPLWLLDLTPDSVLERHADQARAHNAAFRSELACLSPTVAAAMPAELWEAFF
jgi:hypothetical protein